MERAVRGDARTGFPQFMYGFLLVPETSHGPETNRAATVSAPEALSQRTIRL